MNLSSNKILSSLCYFSVFFAPFLFPIVIWIISSEYTAHNAKKALAYHALPYICLILAIIIFGTNNTISNSLMFNIMFFIAIILILASIFYVIKNIYMGIKVLLDNER
ncbi:hypothetical protein BUY45_06175 [Staphylococcus devriesei]|uniref:DUF4870 domain-containing protein n=1 Tax=Staphylococcus devriesei TaxID=586733 RepID=UPI000D1CCADD|nr:DUF4870 domain-containing protein [Staphylococcus devriesei]PTF03969.1 hypothetical protein BUY45_06175 [Staphylococcus devriesei]